MDSRRNRPGGGRAVCIEVWMRLKNVSRWNTSAEDGVLGAVLGAAVFGFW